MAEGFATTDDGVRLWFAVDGAGAGPPLVLAHGGPGLADDLGPLAALISADCTVVRWHQRGVGRSDPVGPHSLARDVADLEAIRTHLGHERWIVGGHSFGATLALHAALAHPARAAGLLSVAGVGTGRAWHAVAQVEAARRLTADQRRRVAELDARDRTADEEVEWRALHWLPDLADPDRTRALAHATAMAESTGPICWEANRLLRAEVGGLDEEAVLARCRQLDVPALLLHGAEDPRPAWSLDTLVAALPQAELVVVPGAGHRPWVEAPAAVGAAIRGWLRSVGSSGGPWWAVAR